MAVRLKDRIEANIRQSDKVNSSLSIQLNSGTATVYDGSSAKTINVTPAAINAVNKSGDTMTGVLNAHGGITLNSTTAQQTNPEYILGIKAFASGGNVVWASKENVTVGSADKLTSSAGSSTLPVYFSGGKPVATGTSLAVSITGNAATATTAAACSGNSNTATSLAGKYYPNRMKSPNISGVRVGMPPFNALALRDLGIPLGTDPEFINGTNSCSVYDNAGTGKVTVTRIADTQSSANGSGYILEIKHTGTGTNPGRGGFVQGISSRANAIFLQLFRAKLPEGYTLVTASNPMGSNYTDTWITDNIGTGKWEWYGRIVLCGESGTFSGGGHVYVSGGTDPTSSTPLIWYISYAERFDITKATRYDYLPLTGGNLTGLLTIYTNGKYYQIGCQNAGWAHHSTDATSGHWFNKDVAVQGNIYCGSSYNTKVLTVAGDRMTGTLTRDATSTSWIDMTHGYGAIIYLDKPAVNGGATACWAVKTNTGAWGCGNLSGNDNLYFVWGSDANYNAGTNSANSGIYMSSNGVLYGAAWNDYAEFRETKYKVKPGRVVSENGDDTLSQTYKRLQPVCSIVSDTYGFAIGETEKCKTPLAMAGRVLAYPYEDRDSYKPGDAVCSGPNGTVSKMTCQEKVMYPECIVGYVSCVPDYEVWGEKNTKVNGRIWIKVI